MGRDTFPGGGSIIRLTEDGTNFQGSHDRAEEKQKGSFSKDGDNKRPTNKEIEKQSQEDDKQEAKLVRDFISQCATAHVTARLNATFPVPSGRLKPWITKRGGNVSWIVTAPTHRSLFQKSYCRAVGREIRVEELMDGLARLAQREAIKRK